MIVGFEVPGDLLGTGKSENLGHAIAADSGGFFAADLVDRTAAENTDVGSPQRERDGDGAASFFEVGGEAIGIAGGDRRGDAGGFEVGILQLAACRGDAGGEGGKFGNVDLIENAAEVDGVVAVFTGTGDDGLEIPGGTAEGHDGEFHGVPFWGRGQ